MTGDELTLQAPTFRSRRIATGAARSAGGRRPAGARTLRHARTSLASAIDKSLPGAVGAFVDWIVNESGWKVTERSGTEPVAVTRASTSACSSAAS